jgi:hypothetical protein
VLHNGNYWKLAESLPLPAGFQGPGDFVSYVEAEAEAIVGDYIRKEHEARIEMLGNLPRLNRVFDAMGVVYME